MMIRGDEGGFTLLEAVVALAIIALTGVAALGAVGAELRGAERAKRALEMAALAQHRMAVLELLPREELSMLADSIARGRFAAPFERYLWEASTDWASGEESLVDLEVVIRSESGSYPLRTRLFRPAGEGLLR